MTSALGKPRRPGSRGRKSRTSVEQVEKSQPLAQMCFSGARHLLPERIPSARSRRESTVALRVIDLTEETLETIKTLSPTLRFLNISGLKLTKLNDDVIAPLEALERIDLSSNRLNEDSFPASFQKLKSIKEVDLTHNKLAVIPRHVKRLRELTRLKLAQNRIASIEGVEKMKRLQVLMLQENQVEYLPRETLANLRKLEILSCAKNCLRELHPDVRFLRHLKDIDLSSNKLTSLPTELFLLPRLDCLNASCNRLTRIPTINIRGRAKNRLTMCDLSENRIIKFPEHLLPLTDKLDLCRNRIRSLPVGVLKRLEVGIEQPELLLEDNPLITPPLDVCVSGVKAIIQYFQEVKADIKVYQGIKVLKIKF